MDGSHTAEDCYEKTSEVIDILETVRAYMRAAEADAEPYEGEGLWPAAEPWIAMRHWYPDAYARVAAIVEQLAAGGLAVVPPTGRARVALLERLPLPPIEYLDETGTVGVLSFSGRPTLVNLWAPWCLPCVEELHQLKDRLGELD